MGVDRISQGPAIDGLAHFDSSGSVVLDQTNGILECVPNNRVMSADRTCLFFPLGSQTALVTITTAQNLINKTLNAGVLNKITRTMIIRGSLIYTSPGGSTPTITLAVTLGGVALCSITTGAINTTASTNMPIQFEFTIQTASTGSAGTIESHGRVDANLTANTPAAAPTPALDTNTAVSSAVNLTTALALLVTIAASSTVTSAQLKLATIEVVF